MSVNATGQAVTGLPRVKSIYSARALIRPFQEKAPVDVQAIAKHFGINVWELTNLNQNISGKLFPDSEHGGTSGFSIGVNAGEGYERKRFTIAHELAHFLLHRNRIAQGIEEDTFFRGGLSTQEEVDANKLAADILMPFHLIRKLSQAGVKEIGQLARKLEVSEPAMKNRLHIPIY